MQARKKTFYDWPVTQELHAHMKMRKEQNLAKGLTPAEQWFKECVSIWTPYKWTKQATWGFRLFDFWCHFLGCAVEIDGPNHDELEDKQKDLKEWNRSRIVTFRIRNYNKEDAERFLSEVNQIGSWNKRRHESNMKLILNAGQIEK